MIINDIYSNEWPRSVEEAVERVLYVLSEEDKDRARNTSKYEFVLDYDYRLRGNISMIFGAGRHLNQELFNACGTARRREAVQVILSALWETLHGEANYLMRGSF